MKLIHRFYPGARVCFALAATLLILAGTFLSLRAQTGRADAAKNPKLTERKSYKRAEFAFQQRAFPQGKLPERALERASSQIQRAEAAERKRGRRPTLSEFLSNSGAMAPMQPLAPSGEAAEAPALSSDPAVTLAAPYRASVASQWVNIGPAPITGSQLVANNAYEGSLRVSGRVSAIAVDPTNVNRWIIGGAQGGIWVTDNAGSSWTAKSDHLPSLAIGAIAFARDNTSIVYAGSGESVTTSDAYGGVGLYKSDDGGNTWRHVESTAATFRHAAFSEIRVLPSDSRVLVATTVGGTGFGRGGYGAAPGAVLGRGIFKSYDGGTNWEKKFPTGAGAASDATDLEVDAGDFNNQFAAVSTQTGSVNGGVFRSRDAGETWQLINGPWTNETNLPGGVGRIEMAMSPADSNVLYVSIQDRFDSPQQANDGGLLGIWKTINALATNPADIQWVRLPTVAGVGSQLWYDHQLAVDPNDSRIMYFGAVPIFKYDGRDGAANTWTNITRNTHADQHAMAFAGNRLILGNDGGLYYSDDTAADWVSCNTNLALTQFYNGAVHPNDRNLAIAGAQDNGTSKFVGNMGWPFIGLGDGGPTAISNANPSQHWASSRFNLQILRTRNGAEDSSAFVRVDTGITDNLNGGGNNRSLFIAPFEKHPTRDDVFIAGTDNVWRSDNFFSADTPSWSINSPNLAAAADGSIVSVSALAFAPSDDSAQIYAYGASNGILRLTTDGGSTWTNIDPKGEVPQRWVTDLAFDPKNPDVLYVTLSGFDEAIAGAPGHVFRTTNARAAEPTWRDITPPVNLPHNTIAVDPTHPEVLYVGTDLGLWEGITDADGSVTWTHVGPGQGLPNVAVFDVHVQWQTRRLFAFTHGRGAFVADLFPANDHLENARVITGSSGRIVDTNINATVENGEPDHFPGTPENGARSVWFLWTAPLGGNVVFDTIDSRFDTDLAVYSLGNSWQQIALPAVASDNNSGGNGTSRVTFQANAGEHYLIAMNGSGPNDAGFYALNWSVEDHDLPVVTVTEPPHNSGRAVLTKIAGTAVDASGIQNNEVRFTLFHEGSGKFWNGSGWADAMTSLTATVLGDGTWSYTSVPTGNLLGEGRYFISANAVDRAGNASQPTSGVNQTSFTVDKQPPTASIVDPPNNFVITKQQYNFEGVAADNRGIARVVLFIRRNADSMYWSGSGWVADPLTANLSSDYDASTGTWRCTAARPIPGYPPANLTNGSYNFIAIAFDTAGNQTQTDSVVTVDYHRIMTWEGSVSGDWDNAANWESKDLGAGLVIPDDSAIVVINNGRTVSTNQNRTVYSVRLLDGRIQFTNGSSRTLTTLKRSTWSGGSFGGTWNVAEGATLELIGDGAKHLSDGSVLNNYGAISWGGPGPIQAEGNGFAENPIINNKEGGIFEVRAGGNLFSRASTRAGTPVFNNEAGARFVKVEPTVVPGFIGTNLLQNADAEAGSAAADFTSIVPPSGWTTEGSFTSVLYSAGGPNDLNTEDAAAVNGGTRYLAGGPGSVHSYATQTVDVSALSTQIDAGQLTAALSGLFGGYLNEADKMEISATFIDETGTPLAATSTGRVSPTDRGGVSQLLPRSTITNLPSGTRTVRITLAAGRQAGEYNDGYADNLRFEIGGGGLGTGPLIVDTFNFNNSGEMECQAGAIAFNSPTSFVNAGALSGTGRFEIQGSTFDVQGPLILEEAIFRIDHGDLRAHGDGTASFITVGNAQVQVRGGRVFGKFTNTEGSRLLLTDPEIGPYRKFFGDGFVLENFGFVTWTGGGTIQAEGNGFVPNPVFNNKDGGRFDIAADGPLFSRASERAGTPIFNNEAGGLFIKTAGEGTTDLTIFDFKNYGQMTANSGKFALKTNFLHSNAPALKGPGVYELLSGKIDVVGSLTLDNTTFTLTAGDMYAGAGGITLVSTTPGKLRLQGGRLFGTFNLPVGSYLELSDPAAGPTPKFFADGVVLNNAGTMTWLGGGTIQAEGNGFAANPIFNNKNGGRFEIAADGAPFSRASGRAGTPLFNNEAGALLIKTAGAGASELTIFDLNNYGQITAQNGGFQFKTGNVLFSNAAPVNGGGFFEMHSGRLDVVGSLAVANGTTFTLLGGDFVAGAGGIALAAGEPSRLRLQGGRLFGTFTVPPGSFLELSDPSTGPTAKFFGDGVIFNNAGTVTWLAGGTIQAEGNGFAPNPVFNNVGRFEIVGDGSIFSRASGRAGTPVFNNLIGGQFVKTAGTGSSLIDTFNFNNRGNLLAQTGVFSFNTNFDYASGGLLAGPGRYEILGGTMFLDGQLSIADTTFVIPAGVLDANANKSATLTSTGTGKFVLLGGQYRGKLTLSAGSRLEFADPQAGPAAKFFADQSVFDNYGTVVWPGGGKIQAHGDYNNNFIFNNKAGGRFEVGADGELFSRASHREGTPIFNNEDGATFIKTGGASFTELTVFKINNYGQMTAQTGGFQFKTNVLFSDAEALEGAGRPFEMRTGRLDIVGALNAGNSIVTLFGTDIVAAAPGAALIAPQAGRLRLQDGRYHGTFNVPAESFVEFSDAPDAVKPKFFADQSVFNNAGTVAWLGGGKIQAHGDYNNNFVFNNKPGGRFEVAADGELFSRASHRDGTPIFNNEAGALFIKTAGESFSELTVFKFNNYGQMNAETGGFQFKTHVLFSNAAPLIGAGKFYEMRSGRFDIIGALNVGNTTMTLFGTDIVANGPITLEAPAAGRLRLQEGRYFGTFNVPSGSFVEFSDAPELVRAKFFGDGSVFNNEGTVSWLGGGTIQAEGNGFVPNLVFNNNNGGVFEIAGEGQIFSRASWRAGTPVFNNLAGALVHKTVGGDTLFDIFNFDNRGSVQCDDGTLSFNTGAAAHDGATYSGAGAYRMAGGTWHTDGTVTFGSAFSVLAGEVFGPATFATNDTGLLRWGGGRFSGHFALAAASHMLIDDGESATATEKDLSDGAVFDNFGTIVWTGAGAIQGGGYGFAPNPIFNNKPGAVFNAAATGVFNRESTRDGTPVFNNAGLVNIGIGSGVLTFSGWDFTQAATGKLNIDIGGTNEGEFDRLQVNQFGYGGRATLNGIVSINLINGFTLTPGTSLTPITFNSRTGQFADWHSLGSIVSLTYTSTAMSLTGKAHADENSDWKRLHFGDPTAPAAQPLADANGDGVPNLLEYALGNNPLAPGGVPPIGVAAADSAAPGAAPGAALNSTDAAADALTHLALTYTRPAGAAALKDVSYSVERETSLMTNNWSASDVVQQSAAPSQDGLKETLTMRSAHLLGETPAEFLRLTVALTSAGGTSASSDPIAATTVTIAANGSKALSFGVDNSPVFVGTVSTRSADGIQTNAAGWAASAFGPYESKPHVARMLSGNSAGRQFRIVSNTADTLTLATNGLDLSVEVAAGDRYQIIAVDTLETLLGATAPALTRSSTPGAADNLQVRIPLGWLTYFSDGAQWLRQGAGDASQNGVILPPEQGVVFVHRGAGSLPFTLTGVVPMTDLKTDLPAGQTTMLGNRFPLATTLSGLYLHSTPGWSVSPDPALADQVLMREDTGWATYYHDGSNWLRVGAGATPQDPTIGIGEAVLVVRRPGVDITVQQPRQF